MTLSSASSSDLVSELRDLLDRLGWTQRMFGDWLGTQTGRTYGASYLSALVNGRRPVPPLLLVALRALVAAAITARPEPPALVAFRPIPLVEANRLLEAWEHPHGRCRRPVRSDAHALMVGGEVAAVTVTSGLITPPAGGLFWREDAVELARLCVAPGRQALTRVALRLWREAVFPVWGRPVAVSYSDAEVGHDGGLYRHDGWTRLDRRLSSGPDSRTRRRASRDRTLWWWAPGGLPDYARLALSAVA